MITQEEIKNELKDIRFYYSKKTMFEAAFKETKGNNISELVDKYNEGKASLRVLRKIDAGRLRKVSYGKTFLLLYLYGKEKNS